MDNGFKEYMTFAISQRTYCRIQVTNFLNLRELENLIEVVELQKELLFGTTKSTKKSNNLKNIEDNVHKRTHKSSIKQIVLILLENSGVSGLTVNQMLEAAEQKGEELKRGSVSTLLSRLNKDGVVACENSSYYLEQFKKNKEIQII